MVLLQKWYISRHGFQFKNEHYLSWLMFISEHVLFDILLPIVKWENKQGMKKVLKWGLRNIMIDSYSRTRGEGIFMVADLC